MTILHEEEDYLVVIKPRGLSTAPLKDKEEETLVSLVGACCPKTGQVRGRQGREGGLLHRLDRDTEGLVLCAKSQDFYDSLQQQAALGKFNKTYLAYCDVATAALAPDHINLPHWRRQLETRQLHGNYHLACSFVKAAAKSARVRAIQHSSRHSNNQVYSTGIHLQTHRDVVQAICSLSRGFRHQVRASLCGLGLPIIGDPFYPSIAEKGVAFLFWATAISWYCPRRCRWIRHGYNPLKFVNT